MPVINIRQGGPDIEPGVYQVQLNSVEGPRTIVAQNGPNAGESFDVFDWMFVVETGPYEGTEIEETTSTSSGPRSKLYGWITALNEGRPPAIGQPFDTESVIGRSAIATIERNNSGWPKIANLSAMPTQQRAAPAPTAVAQRQTTAVRQPARAPIQQPQPVAAQGGDLPF